MPNATVAAIGVISGTSVDGIDVALVETDGDTAVRRGPGATYPYPAATREAVLAACADPDRAERDPLAALEAAVTDAHAGAVERFLAEHGIARGRITLVGLHGQTVLHRPERRFTRQLGDGQAAARRLGIPVVARFRHADVAAGGQGAPLAPLYHRALAANLSKPLMVLNLGGVANVTYLADDATIAFDTGPASAILDDFMRRRRGLSFDEDGRLAAGGTVDEAAVAGFLADPFFARPAPKSLDRNDFHRWAHAVDGLSDADGAATLAAMTVASIAAALQHVPDAPKRWIVGGGGRKNRFFMQRLADALHVPVDPVEAVGWDGDFLEAECFGYLAVRSAGGLPLSLPTTTGVPQPLAGGELFRP